MEKDYFLVDKVLWKVYSYENTLWAHSDELKIKVEADTRMELIREATKVQMLLCKDHPKVSVASYHPKDYALKGDTLVEPGDDVGKVLGA